MSAEQRETLSQVFSEVAENLAFMFIEAPEDDMPPEPDGPCVVSEMTFTGPSSGKLALAVPEALCPVIAANVLGIELDDELAMAESHDALNELLNVTCGNLLTALAGDEPVFDLTVPTTRALTPEEWAAMQASPQAITVIIEDNPAVLQLIM